MTVHKRKSVNKISKSDIFESCFLLSDFLVHSVTAQPLASKGQSNLNFVSANFAAIFVYFLSQLTQLCCLHLQLAALLNWL